jgi:hypothetical protein
VITDDDQLAVALRQLAGFKDMLEAMTLHLSESELSPIAAVSESYQHRILKLHEEICDYLLRQR